MVATSLLGACGSQQASTPGQLVVAIETDMALPDQVDTIELSVTVGGTTIYDYPLPVGAAGATQDTQPIPATLTLVQGPDPNTPATIRVTGLKNGFARTLRQATSTIPSGRTATLRMPVQWLCDGTAQPVAAADGGITYQSACGPEGTCQAGKCVTASVDARKLPSYQPQDVFGGGSAPPSKGTTAGACFDTIACMVGGTVETPDDPSTCTVAVPSDASHVNVALRVANDGICDTTGETCFVPLDGNSSEGWTLANGRAALPPAVCDKLRNGLVQGVVVSTGCATKSEGTPPCGAWSSVTPAADASTGPAGTDAGPPPTPTLLASLTPQDAGAVTSACCPLLADSTSLYTCLCSAGASPTIVSINPADGTMATVGSFAPINKRAQYAAALASTAGGSQVYWVDRTSGGDGGTICPVESTAVSPAGPTSSPAQTLCSVSGDIYDSSDLLLDANYLYALADAVAGTGSTVQLLRIDRAGKVTPLDSGGTRAAFQFAQDATSVYVAVATDQALDEASVEHVSRIVAFPKAAGGTPTTLQQVTLTTMGTESVGFIGLQDDLASLFALYEAPPAADGTVEAQVLKINGSDAGPAVVYQETIDPTVVKLRLLGAVNGAVLLVRDSTPVTDAGTSAADGGPTGVPRSAVLVIPPGGGAPRIAASFEGDSPIFEVQTPSFTSDTFWLNASGRVFRLPAGALR